MLEEEKTKVGGSCPLTLQSRLMIRRVAGDRDQRERGAQEEDEWRGRNGRQLDR